MTDELTEEKEETKHKETKRREARYKETKHLENESTKRKLTVENIVEELRIMDDTLFRIIAAEKSVCQEIIRTILGDDKLEVISSNPQYTFTSLHREIILDTICRLSDGRIINVEVQKGKRCDDIRRCRFHISSITANLTPKGTDFSDIPDVAVIYISEYDALGDGKAVTFATMCKEVNGVYIPLNDGAGIYYANTAINDCTDKSELLQLFLEREAFDNEKFPNISERFKYYKEDRKGRGIMCELVERYASQVAEEVAAEAEEKARVEVEKARAEAEKARAEAEEKAKAEAEKAKKISAIKSAKTVYVATGDENTAILCIRSSLDISEEQAKEIFEKEVL